MTVATTADTARDVSEPRRRNRGIQVLRALAVLAVIAYHLNHEWLPGGFVGVDIFFVISGFVITQSLIRDSSGSLGAVLYRFYTRRFFRIAPALFVFLGVTALFVALFVPRGMWIGADGPATALAASVGLGNFSLYFGLGEYFNERLSFNAFTHTWSLGLEEQFYVIFPVLLWLGLWMASRHYDSTSPLVAMAWVAIPTAFSLVWSIFETQTNPTAAFYLLTSRFWELGIGALGAMALRYGLLKVLESRGSAWLLALGAVTLTTSFVFASAEAFPFPWAVPAVLGTLAMIWGFQHADSSLPRPARALVRSRVWVTIGDWSYSLYLWHWGVIVGMRWTIGLDYWWHYPLALILTTALGVASYYGVERPILSKKLHISLRPTTVIATAVASTVFVAGSLSFSDRVTEAKISLSVTAQGEFGNPPPGTPEPREVYAGYEGAEGRTIFLVGNSHAGHLVPLVTEFGQAMDFDFVFLSDVECPVLSLQRLRQDCEEHQQTTQQILDQAQPGDVVLFSSLRLPRISTIIDGQRRPQEEILQNFSHRQSEIDEEELLAQAERALEPLRDAGLQLYVASPTPLFPSPVFRCLDWFNRMNPVCDGGFSVDRDYMMALSQPVRDRTAELEQRGLTTTWEIFDEFCPDETCVTERDGRHMFSDADHLSRWGTYVLVAPFAELLEEAWNVSPPQGE